MSNLAPIVFVHLTRAIILLALLCPMVGAAEPFAPPQDKLPVPPPKKAIVLLSAETNRFLNMSGEQINWPEREGVLTSTRGNGRSNHIQSKWHFRDADIHVEFKLPNSGTGNSGIYIHGNYEMQIIHSLGKQKFGNEDMGSLYGFSPALVNAARDRDEWQVYDIRYRAPRRDTSQTIVDPGEITAWLNGKQIHRKTKFGEPRSNYHPYRYGATDYLKAIWKRQKETMTGPVFLQDHDNAVQFRNVWIVPLDELAHEYEP